MQDVYYDISFLEEWGLTTSDCLLMLHTCAVVIYVNIAQSSCPITLVIARLMLHTGVRTIGNNTY